MQGSKGNSHNVFSECANKKFVNYPCRQIYVQYDFPFIQESSDEGNGKWQAYFINAKYVAH